MTKESTDLRCYQDANSVEKALLFNEKKFPPMLPRMLRVTRAKNIKKTASHRDSDKPSHELPPSRSDSFYKPRISSQVQSFSGRAGKLLGRAGAAQFRGSPGGKSGDKVLPHKYHGVAKSPESIVFEGHRASSKQGKGSMKIGRPSKKQGKPQTRSSRRGTTFKESRGKKSRS